MLHTLGRRAGVVVAPDAVDLLLECHQRIRHFTQLAVALTRAAEAPAPEVATAAASVLRYFTEALPRHAADEDESIAPRLVAAEAPAAVGLALDAMTREHATLHETLDELVPRWRAVAAEPGRIAEEAGAMRPLTARLAELWVAHLGPEESLIFPAVRRLLGADALDAIQREMRARRTA
jgi:hemerythrin-like domain-containing protein